MSIRSSIKAIDRTTTTAEKFGDVWKKAKTGDLFFVSGARDLDGICAMATKFGAGSAFSHIGLIIRDPTEKMWSQYGRLRAKATIEGGSGAWNQGEDVPRDRELYLLDSDWEEDGTVDGPALRPLQEVISEYLCDDYHGTDTDIIIRYLECDDARRAEIKGLLEGFMLEVAGRPYEAKGLDISTISDGSFPQLAKCLWGLSIKEDLDKLFCSELVAAGYRAAGLLAADINATNYAPGHFDNRRMNELLGGASLGPEIRCDDDAMLYRINVSIKNIKKLEDTTYMDTVDPYVVVKFHGRFRFKTNVIKNDRNPEFNVAYEQLFDGKGNIQFEVWDKNTISKDTLVAKGVLPSACVICKDGKEDGDPIEAPCTTFDGVLELEQEYTWDMAPMCLRIDVLQVPCEELVVKEQQKLAREKAKQVAGQAKKMFRMHGCISKGGDLFPKPITMTLERAMQQAAVLPGCKGFCFRSPPPTEENEEEHSTCNMKTPVAIHFKSKLDNCQVPGWETFGFQEDKKEMSHEFVDASSTAGQKLQYLSDKQNKWFECTVTDGGDGHGGLTIDIQGSKRQVPANKCATNLRPIYAPGDKAKYYSVNKETWFDCTVTDVKLGANASEGGIEVEIDGNTRMVDNAHVVSYLKPAADGAAGGYPSKS